jgi:hypothetical protein
MNVEIGAEAALFPEKEYINGIAVAVYEEQTWRGFALHIFGLVSQTYTINTYCIYGLIMGHWRLDLSVSTARRLRCKPCKQGVE